MLMSGFLARMFRFQPSEIDGLDVTDFVDWVNEGKRQNDAEQEAMAQNR